jgi:hypothetical protein
MIEMPDRLAQNLILFILPWVCATGVVFARLGRGRCEVGRWELWGVISRIPLRSIRPRELDCACYGNIKHDIPH